MFCVNCLSVCLSFVIFGLPYCVLWALLLEIENSILFYSTPAIYNLRNLLIRLGCEGSRLKQWLHLK